MAFLARPSHSLPDPVACGAYAGISTYLRSTAFLALSLDALVGADARPQALLAPTPIPDAFMLAYLRPAAFLAEALDALVGSDAQPQALLALAPAAVISIHIHFTCPPHSLHLSWV